MSTVECYIDVDDDGGDGGVGGDGRYRQTVYPERPDRRPPTADRRPSRAALLDKSTALEHMRPVTATEDFLHFLCHCMENKR